MPLPELALIQRIRRRWPRSFNTHPRHGDDCAILRPPRTRVLVTTDFSLEGATSAATSIPPPRSATAASPAASATSPPWEAPPSPRSSRSPFPADLPQRWVDGFFAGLPELAKQYSVPRRRRHLPIARRHPRRYLPPRQRPKAVPSSAPARTRATFSMSPEPSASPSPHSQNSVAARSCNRRNIRAISIPTLASPSANTCATRNSPPP